MVARLLTNIKRFNSNSYLVNDYLINTNITVLKAVVESGSNVRMYYVMYRCKMNLKLIGIRASLV